MDTAKNLPIMKEVDDVIAGGDWAAVYHALFLSRKGRRVLLVLPETYLAGDICGTLRYGLEELPESLRELVLLKPGLHDGKKLHPDKFKRYLEELCEENGIDVLYFVQLVDVLDKIGVSNLKAARVGGKFGLGIILCEEVYVKCHFSQAEGLGREGVADGGRIGNGKKKYFRTFLTKSGMDSQDYEILEASCYVNKKTDGEGRHGQEDKKPWVELEETLYRCKETAFKEYARIRGGRKEDDIRLGRFAAASFEHPGEAKKNQHSYIRLDIDSDLSHGDTWLQVKACNPLLKYGNYPCLEDSRPVKGNVWEYDLVVAGGGTSGVMAALHGARNGLKTVLVEPGFSLGGTSVAGGVSTYWFGRRFRPVAEVDEGVGRIADSLSITGRKGIWSSRDDSHPGIRDYYLLSLCREAGVEIVLGQMVYGVCDKKADNKSKTGIATCGVSGNHFFFGSMIMDATGDGDAAVFAGGESVYGSDRDCITYWGSLAQYTSPDTYKNNFSSMLICADPVDYTRFIRLGRKRGGQVFDHGIYVSMRESRHIKGTESLDLRDWLLFREQENAVYTCYSNYDPKGKLDADIIYHGILPQQGAAAVPLGTMCPVKKDGSRIKGMYVLGKAIHVTHNVFPGLRMQPDLMQQGAVMGMLAAKAFAQGKYIEDLPAQERKSAVTRYTGDPLCAGTGRMLTERGKVQEKEKQYIYSPMEQMKAAVESLKEETRTHWVDVDFTYEEKQLNPWMIIYTGNRSDAIPLLKARWQKEESPLLSLRLACALLWHGCEDGTGHIRKAARDMLKEAGEQELPLRKESVMCAQLLPDHGVMPELVYLLNVLTDSKNKAIVEIFEDVCNRLLSQERDYLDIRKGTYHYIESVALGAERTGMPEFGPLLERLLEIPELQKLDDTQRQTDLLTERLQILKLILARALVRLEGGEKSYGHLLDCMEHSVLSIRYSVCMELENLLGVQWGLNTDKWREEIKKNPLALRQAVRKNRIW